MKTLICNCDKCGEQVERKEIVEISIASNWNLKPADLCKECAAPYLQSMQGLFKEVKATC